MNKIKNYFSDWTMFEKSWLIISLVITITLSFIWGDNTIALISSISGIISVVLCAKGKLSNYAFGMLQALTYMYICYQNNLFGEVTYNLIMIPIIIFGVFSWKKNMSAEKSEVKARNLTAKGWIILIIGSVVAILAYTQILNLIGGEHTLLDSASTVLSLIASILMVTRFSEQWLIWIFVNCVSIALWVTVLLTGDTGVITLVVMWSAYLFNSIYGYINWRKLAK